MRHIDPHVSLTLFFGLAMLVSWILGWEVAALVLFMLSALIRSVEILMHGRTIRRGPVRDTLLRESSVAYLQSSDPTLFLMHFGLARFSEAVVWPSDKILTTVSGLILLILNPRMSRMTRERFHGYTAFVFPPALVCMAAHGFQSWFLLTQLSTTTQSTWVFQYAVALQLAGFVALGLHFFSRRHFMKNFSHAGLWPFAFVMLTALFAIPCAALASVLLGVAFPDRASPDPTYLNFDVLFSAARTLALNEGLFDFLRMLRESDTALALLDAIRTSLTQLTWHTAFDGFLSAFIVLAPVRAIWSSLKLRRDDEDRRTRAQYFLSAGRTGSARIEADKMDNVAEACSIKALAAVCDGNYPGFLREIELVDGSANFASVGRDPDALRYVHFLQAIGLSPVDAAHFGEQLESLWKERESLPSLIFLCTALADYHGGAEALQIQLREWTWGAEVDQAFDFVDAQIASDDDFVSALSVRYPQHSLALDLALLIRLQHVGTHERHTAKKDAVCAKIESALEKIAKRMETSVSGDNLAFAFLGILYAAQAHATAYYGADPAQWIRVTDLLERGMVSAGLSLATYANIRR